jgi:hypothetical protein
MTKKHDHSDPTPTQHQHSDAEPHHGHEQGVPARRSFFKRLLLPLALTVAGGAVAARQAKAGYGNCTQCNCPGYIGSGYTCVRGGCGHHYDSHW